MRRLLFAIVLLSTVSGAVGIGVPPASATISTFTVTTTADGVRVQGSLRWALNRSEQVDGLATIVLSAGQTYVLNRCAALSEDVGTTGDLDVSIDSILGIDGNGATIRQTCAGERVLQAAGHLTLDELVITGGDAEPDTNQADPQGGGILADELTLRHTTVEGNASTGSGGGVRADELALAASVVRDNASGLNGGGAAVTSGNLMVGSSIVTGNTAAEGGGIVLGTGTIRVDTSIVADNAETTPGAGTADGVDLDVFSGAVTLFHATVRGGDGDGPAIRGNTSLGASVVSQGQADAACGAGEDTSQGQNVDDDDSCDLDQPSDQPDVADVGLGPDLQPLADSVLRDHDTNCIPFIDLRGDRRPQGPGCEIGALELDHHPDGELRRAGTARFVGNDVFNAAGVNQTVTVPLGANPVTVDLRAQNDGDLPDAFLVRGLASNGRFTVRYQLGSTNVTPQVVAGTFSTAQLAPGARSAVLKMVITARPSVPHGAVRDLPMTFTSSLDAARRDVVVAKARRS
jgi:hypothetical protein